MKLVDEAIFLFRTNYSDTSLIATYYTKEHGLQKFMFKGGKKKSAKKKGESSLGRPLSFSE